jgi:hypothetical protein
LQNGLAAKQLESNPPRTIPTINYIWDKITKSI